MWLYTHFVDILTVLGSALPPIGAIILADFFILNRGKYKDFSKMRFKKVNWIALLAWVLGVVSAVAFPGIPPINALIAAALSHVLITLVVEKVILKNTMKAKVEEV